MDFAEGDRAAWVWEEEEHGRPPSQAVAVVATIQVFFKALYQGGPRQHMETAASR